MVIGISTTIWAAGFRADANTVALWHFDEGAGDTVHDASGNGNHGIVIGPRWTKGFLNQSLNFDGIDDFVHVGGSPSLNIENQITIEAWIFIHNNIKIGEDISGIIDRGPELFNHGGYYLRMGAKTVTLGLSYPYKETFSDSDLVTSQWYYIAATYDNDSVRIFINGALNKSAGLGQNNLDKWNDTSRLTIGVEAFQPPVYTGHFFKGKIDEIRISRIARSPAEIASHWNGMLQPVGLVAYYPFNGNTNDESGNGHNGTVYGAALATDRFNSPDCAYYFDGSSYIDIGNSINLGMPYTQFAVALWFKAFSHGVIISDYQGSAGSGDDTFAVAMGLDDGSYDSWRRNRFTTGTRYLSVSGHDSYTSWSDSLYADSLWHFAVYQMDGESLLTTYIDGVLESQKVYEPSLDYCNNPYWRIGVNYFVGKLNAYYTGVVDDIRIYNCTLSLDEIQALYTPASPPELILIRVPSPTSERRPELKWHPVTGAAHYTIEIATTMSFANPITRVNVADTSFIPFADLPLGTIYWKVKSSLSDKYSSVGTFYVLSDISSNTHVFWYKAMTNKYPINECNTMNYGPCLPPDAVIHEGMIASGTVAQHSGSSDHNFSIGSGADDQQGRCGFIWSKDLNELTGSVNYAVLRGELNDGHYHLCWTGPINIRCGVADVQGNRDTWGGVDFVPETADWQDFLNPLSSSMGFDFMTPTLAAEEIVFHQGIGGRADDFEPSELDSQFFEIDITDQVNWILANAGQYAVMFLVPPNEGNTGKVFCYGYETCPGTDNLTYNTRNPWTRDGNTVHLMIQGYLEPTVHAAKTLADNDKEFIGPNSPNPFNPATRISYNLGPGRNGVMKIFDIRGKVVFKKVVKGAGAVIWNAEELGSGVYLLEAAAGSKKYRRKLVLQR
jgi:hypothetical protein